MQISARLPTHNLRPSTIAAVSAFLRACARACLLLLEEGTSSRRVRSAVVFRALGSHGDLLFASSKTARVKFFAASTIRWASVMPRRSCWSSFSGAHQRHVVFPALLKALLSFPELLKVHSCPRLPSHRTSFGALATLGLAPEELAAVRLFPSPSAPPGRLPVAAATVVTCSLFFVFRAAIGFSSFAHGARSAALCFSSHANSAYAFAILPLRHGLSRAAFSSSSALHQLQVCSFFLTYAGPPGTAALNTQGSPSLPLHLFEN